MAIPLIGPDGRKYTIEDPANVAEAEKLGYRVATPEAPQTLGEQARGFASEAKDVLEVGAHGVLKGITGGLSDVALNPKPTGEYPQRDADMGVLREQQREKIAQHPIAEGVGEVVGMVTSPINKVGLAVRGGVKATTALGRIGAAALGEGAEGLLYGAGNTMSDAALGNYDLTAEKMVAGVGLGGVLGLAGGGVGAGLSEGFKAVVPKLARALVGAKGPMEEFAENRWLKAGGGIQSDIKKIPEAERGAVANVIREAMNPAGKLVPDSLDDAAQAVATERDAVAKQLMQQIGVGDAGGLLPKMGRDEALIALDKGFKQNGDRMGVVLDQADQMGARPTFSGALRRFDDLEVGLNPAERDIIASDLKNARKYILEMGAAPVGSPKNSFAAMNSLKSTLQGDINWADSGAKNGLKKKLVGIIKDELDDQFAVQMGPNLAAEFQSAKAAYGALKQAAKAVKGKNATGADAIAALVKDASLALPNLGGKFSALEHATKLIKHGQDRALGNRFISPSDYAVGIAGGMANPLGALAALPAAIAHKVLREKGAGIIASLTDHITKSPRLMVAAQSFGGQLQSAAPALGEYGAPLLQAFANSPADALATHMTWAQANPDYAEKAQAAGFLPETPEEEQHAEAKGNTLAAVAHTLDAQNQEIGRGLDLVFKGGKPPKPPDVHSSQDFGAKRMRAKDSTAAHRRRVEEIREMAANPEALLDRVAGNMGDVAGMAPGVAAAMTRTAHAAVAYLAQQSQEPPRAGPLARGWVPTQAEQHAFAQRLEAVEQPMSVLKHAAAGTLVPAQWEAVQAVYPLLARQIQDLALERLADPPKDVPYRARLMLSLITGIDVDGSMGTGIALNQQAIAASAAKQPNMSQPDAKKGSLTLAGRSATQAQKREMDTNDV